MTSREFYQAIGNPPFTATARSLEDFLRTFLSLIQPYRQDPGLSADDFMTLLRKACISDVPPFQEDWRTRAASSTPDTSSAVEATLLGQILDLREMDEAGITKYEWRYLGVDAPSGARWYNFDVATFLECATVGSIGGWEEGDPTGRTYVPGPVATTDEDGKIVARDPREIPEPVSDVSVFTWEMLKDFFWCGQNYE